MNGLDGINIDKASDFQGIINKIAQEKGNFSYAKLGEAIGLSRERARQIVKKFNLIVPDNKAELEDLKKLVETGEVSNYTPEELYKRYRRTIAKDFIRGYVIAKGKLFAKSKNGVFQEFIGKVQVEEKTIDELYSDFCTMYPHRKMSHWAFSVALYERGLNYKRKRAKRTFNEDCSKITIASAKFIEFVQEHNIDCTLYSIAQLVSIYEKITGDSISSSMVRKVVVRNNLNSPSIKSIALANRVKALGMNLKGVTTQEIMKAHNEKFPLVPVTMRHFYSYYMKALFENEE